MCSVCFPKATCRRHLLSKLLIYALVADKQSILVGFQEHQHPNLGVLGIFFRIIILRKKP